MKRFDRLENEFKEITSCENEGFYALRIPRRRFNFRILAESFRGIEISKVIEKVLVANMVLSDKEYEAEEKIEQIIKDNSKSNEEKESLKKGVLEELKNNTGNDSRTTILEYQVKLTDKDIVEEITYYVRSKNEEIIKKEKEKYKNSTTYKLIEEKNDKEVQELKYKVTSNIGKTTGEIITILNGLMSNNKFNFTMSDSSQTKDNDTESDLKKLQ